MALKSRGLVIPDSESPRAAAGGGRISVLPLSRCGVTWCPISLLFSSSDQCRCWYLLTRLRTSTRGEFGRRALRFVCCCWRECPRMVISIYREESIMLSLTFNEVSVISNGPSTVHVYSFGQEQAKPGIDSHPGFSWESLLQVLLRAF